jgi:hypothetical protein
MTVQELDLPMADLPWWCCVLPITGDSRAEMESTIIMLGLESGPCNMQQQQKNVASKSFVCLTLCQTHVTCASLLLAAAG